MTYDEFKNKLDGFFDDDETVLFIGAGVSMNIGLPDWKSFAYQHLDILMKEDKIRKRLQLDYETKELLRNVDFRTIISIAKYYIDTEKDIRELFKREYKNIFEIGSNKASDKFNKVKDENSIFRELYNLNLINITTNYDDVFDILAMEEKDIYISSKIKDEVVNSLGCSKKIFFEQSDFIDINKKGLKQGEIYHIHGSVKNIDTMVVSNEDYIKRYQMDGEEKNIYHKFLSNVFKNHNVIFIGYSLSELEILKYLLDGDKGRFDKDKNDKKRLLILDAYDYEEKKMKFLKEYYYKNYSVDIFWYSKNENGYGEINNIVRVMHNKKNQVRNDKINLNRCSNLILKEELSSDERKELAIKIKEFKSLQISFFRKIKKQYDQWYNLLKQNSYFEEENNNNNILGIIEYLNSINGVINEVGDVNSVFRLIIAYIDDMVLKENKDIVFLSSFIEYIVKFYDKLSEFDINSVYSKFESIEMSRFFINNLLRNIDDLDYFRFIEEYRVELLDLILMNSLNDHFGIYNLTRNKKLIDLYLDKSEDFFIENIIKIYTEDFIKKESNGLNCKIKLTGNTISIDYDGKTKEFEYKSLKQIDQELEKIYNDYDDDLKISIKNLFTEDSYQNIFDDIYLFRNERIKFLIDVAEQNKNIKDKIVELLFKSEVFILKKISLYIIKKNNDLNFIVKKIKNKDYDFEYIFRNYEFAGELKIILNWINSYSNINEIEDCLLELLSKGDYIKRNYGEENYEEIWKYERAREITNSRKINELAIKLKEKLKYDYELRPIIGKVEVINNENMIYIEKDKAKKMSLKGWVEYMNEFSTSLIKDDNFYFKYDIRKESKVLMDFFIKNPEKYFSEIMELENVQDYEWIYIIINCIKNNIKEGNNINKYYIDLLAFIKKYIQKIKDIYEKPIRNKYPKTTLIKEICEVNEEILRSNKETTEDQLCLIREVIAILESKISNNEDFYKEWNTDEISYYNNLINSVHYYLIKLEIQFVDKIKANQDESQYIKELFDKRLKRSPKEMFILMGQYYYWFSSLPIDMKSLIKKDMDKENKKLVLIGLSNSRVINKERFRLLKELDIDNLLEEIKDKVVLRRLMEYLSLAYFLGYEDSGLDFIKEKYLSRDIIFKILTLKSDCIRLNDNYTYDDFFVKQIELWEKILKEIDRENTGEITDEIPKSTIIALRDLEGFSDEVCDILKRILKQTTRHSEMSYELFEYLKKYVDKNNFDKIQTVILEFKPDYIGHEIKETFNILEKIDDKKYKQFKISWRCKNPELNFEN
ncbi:SIR2 family protein [Clostridium chrysemydis]|uniref:SIR2 family protein n=1 Tax=Clostridium chrysemydis TaxID=2665504 RepID=UPI0018834D49|nr:SIR2 family protein [Clostridium chrysemydis]